MTTILRLPGEPAELTLPALLLRNAEDHGELPARCARRSPARWSGPTRA
jgi:long-chain acyl-CoA synthetase